MVRRNLGSFLVIFFGCVWSCMCLGTPWAVDASHADLRFKVRHMMVSNVSGAFTGITGEFNIDDHNMTKSSAMVTIDASTIDTNNAKRDEHLKNPDFFDVAKYPQIVFKSKSVTGARGKIKKIVGDLTMHGVTKEIVLDIDGPTAPIKDMQGGIRRGIAGRTKINRKDFGLTWNKVLETGGVAIGDWVDVTLDVELTQPKPTAPQS